MTTLVVTPASPYRVPNPAPAGSSASARELGPRFASFRVHADCPACARPIPINGLSRSLACPSCDETIRVPVSFFVAILDRFEREHLDLSLTKGTMHAGRLAFEYVIEQSDRAPEGLPEQAPSWVTGEVPTATAYWSPTLSPTTNPGHEPASCSSCGQRPVPRIESWTIRFTGENCHDRDYREESEARRRSDDQRRTAEQRKQRRERQQKQSDATALEQDLTRLDGHARLATVTHAALALGLIAAPWVAQMVETPIGAVIFAAYIAHLLFGFVALGVSSRVIHRVRPRDMTFLVWFEFVFVAVMPGVGHLLGYERVFGLLFGENRRELGPCTRWAGYNWAILSTSGLLLITSVILAAVL